MNDAPPLHQLRTSEGWEGWQWMNGPAFFYDKDDLTDKAAARRSTQEWAEAVTEIERLKGVIQERAERVRLTGQDDEPVIINFEKAKAARDAT